MTETGLSLGTPHYMSPEQATAEKEITPRSDIYSLASVLYEMLTGEPPHTAGSAQGVIMKIITDVARPVQELRKNVPSNVAAALSKALEKLPADRFENAKAFSEALANPAFTTGATATRGTRDGRRSVPFPLFVATSGVAIVSLVAATWVWQRSAPVSSTPRARFTLEPPDSQAIVPTHSGPIADGLARWIRDRIYGRVVEARPSAVSRRLDDLIVREIPGTGAVTAHAFSPSGERAFQKADRVLTTVPHDGRPPNPRNIDFEPSPDGKRFYVRYSVTPERATLTLLTNWWKFAGVAGR
jgi:serine/threonine-protein kinase